jgi:transposase-like protein
MSDDSKNLSNVISINESEVKNHLGEIVRSTVEETLNGLLDAEADELCNAKRYERSSGRVDTRAGSYQRGLETKAGKVSLKVPKLRKLTFETAIIERYRRRESSVEEALVQMYLAGVSVRRVEDITEALWGSRVSPSTVSDLNKKIYERIEKWRTRQLTGKHPYVYLDGLYLKRSWGGEVQSVAVLVAFGVNAEGFREILGVCEGAKEDKASWLIFLGDLRRRGLSGTRLFISDKCLGLVEAIEECYPEARWQRCIVHYYRNVFSVVPKGKVKQVASMLKAIHAQEDLAEARKKAKAVVSKLKAMKLKKAAEMISESIEETFMYYSFPREHWRRIRTNNPMERIMREIRRRTKVVGAFPDGQSALMLVSARLRHIAGTKWGYRRYLDMTMLKEVKTKLKAS